MQAPNSTQPQEALAGSDPIQSQNQSSFHPPPPAPHPFLNFAFISNIDAYNQGYQDGLKAYENGILPQQSIVKKKAQLFDSVARLVDAEGERILPSGYFYHMTPAQDKCNDPVGSAEAACITSTQRFQGLSVEEIRLRDYQILKITDEAAKKQVELLNPDLSSLDYYYEPTDIYDDGLQSNGSVTDWIVSACGLTFMREFEGLSMEEIRLRDYVTIGKVGNQAVESRAYFYTPTDVDEGFDYATKEPFPLRAGSCLTFMKEFENASVEEIRLKDYEKMSLFKKDRENFNTLFTSPSFSYPPQGFFEKEAPKNKKVVLVPSSSLEESIESENVENTGLENFELLQVGSEQSNALYLEMVNEKLKEVANSMKNAIDKKGETSADHSKTLIEIKTSGITVISTKSQQSSDAAESSLSLGSPSPSSTFNSGSNFSFAQVSNKSLSEVFVFGETGMEKQEGGGSKDRENVVFSIKFIPKVSVPVVLLKVNDTLRFSRSVLENDVLFFSLFYSFLSYRLLPTSDLQIAFPTQSSSNRLRTPS